MTKKSKKTNQMSLLMDIGYILFKDFPAKILPKSNWIKDNLESAGIRVSHIVYISAAFFWSIMIPVLVFTFTPYFIDLNFFNLLLSTLMDNPSFFIDPLIIRIILTITSGGVTLIVFYTYPLYVSGKVQREIDRNLVYIINYLEIMESAGTTSEEMFASLAEVGDVFGIEQSGKQVMRNVDLLGKDIINAMELESKRTPSKEYKSFLQGFISTVRKGGDLNAYLASMSQKQVSERKRMLNRLATKLNFVAEVFIIALVAFPVVMIVLLTVMESMGGQVLGDLTGLQLMNLMTYAIVPCAAIGLVFFIDMISGKE